MIKTLDIFSSSKTEEIMSRYRPIAPKPLMLPQNPLLHPLAGDNNNGPPQQSPSLKRSRKRSRARTPSSAHKKTKTIVTSFSSEAAPSHDLAKKTHLGLSLHGFGPGLSGFPFTSPRLHDGPAGSEELVTLPLMPYACPNPALVRKSGPAENDSAEGKVALSLFPTIQEKALDLNCKLEIPEEKDLLYKLQTPQLPVGSKNPGNSSIITPQPMRPVGSSISVGCIDENTTSLCASAAPVCRRRAEEVEEEVESEALPTVISDSKNKVRVANSAYKELVGQPECPWLDSMVARERRNKGVMAPKRISGEVVLDLSDASSVLPVSSNGFSCKVKIEWASNGQKIFIIAPCDVTRLSCVAKDYLFTWKFLIPNSRA